VTCRAPWRARAAAGVLAALALVACRGGDPPATASGGAGSGPATASGATTSGASGASAPATSGAGATTTSGAVEQLRAEVVASRPRDPGGFTQGFELDGTTLYESNGLYGASAVRALDRATGTVLRTYRPPSSVFAEGITRAGDRLLLLTWRERVVYVLDAATFAERGTLPYDTEGWGICARDGEVVTSDGSDVLTVRDATTLTARRRISVRLRGEPVRELNELECVGDDVWANVWRTDRIVRVRIADGAVTGVADVPELRPASTKGDADAVLNGIAHVDATGTFLLTGKRWPVIHEVRFTRTGG
jgi:glutamine cyclotransferase